MSIFVTAAVAAAIATLAPLYACAQTVTQVAGQVAGQSASQTAAPVILPAAPDPNHGSVVGEVLDISGAYVPGAKVTLTTTGVAKPLVATSDQFGRYSFGSVPAGHFTVHIEMQGFEAASLSDDLLPGQHDVLADTSLRPLATTEITVTPSREELAEADVKEEETQRVFGVIPNFFVTYKKNPVPLNARQKMELSLHGIVDPFPVFSSAVVAGIQQATNALPGYGSDAAAYGERYGAAYANFASATILRDGLFPALFHQDPRYYYRGYGTKRERILYALSTAVICKGDNGKNQFNYSSLLGNLSAGALTNLYYPPGSRNGIGITIENGLLATAGVGFGHVIQEFVFERITKRRGLSTSNTAPTKP